MRFFYRALMILVSVLLIGGVVLFGFMAANAFAEDRSGAGFTEAVIVVVLVVIWIRLIWLAGHSRAGDIT